MSKRFTTWGNRIKRDGKLLNIEFKTKIDAKLCCKLCNQMDKHQQEYIGELNEIFKWYKEYYGETILDTKMGWNDNNKISKLEKENEQLKIKLEDIALDMENAKESNDDAQYELYKIKKENEQLKSEIENLNQFKENVIKWVDSQMKFNVKKYIETEDYNFKSENIDLHNFKVFIGIDSND